MNLLFPFLTIVGGLIAASSLIIVRKPNARQVFARIAPYQGILGLLMLGAGIWWALRVMPHAAGLLRAAPLAGAVTIGAVTTTLLIGFFLGFGLLESRLRGKSEAAAAKAQNAHAKLARVQAPLGMAGVVLGILVLVA
ncbi:MAG: hypothetical protein R3F56_25075 [Planctomycetota bacterium]